MKKWFLSLNGAITLSGLAFLSFLGRAFLDWRYGLPASLRQPTRGGRTRVKA
jgi:hypothetical protein